MDAAGIVFAILIVAILANVIANLHFPAARHASGDRLAVWAVILLTAPLRRPDWEVMPETFKARSSCSRSSPARR
jgi:hypothetical protein